jgi:hypothetical protein
VCGVLCCKGTWWEVAEGKGHRLGPAIELDVVVRHRGPVAREDVQRIGHEHRRASSLGLLCFFPASVIFF